MTTTLQANIHKGYASTRKPLEGDSGGRVSHLRNPSGRGNPNCLQRNPERKIE